MSEVFQLFVKGEPKAQERPRFSTRAGFVQTYDPEKSRDHKALIGILARQKMEGRMPMEGDLLLTLTIRKNPPSSWSKKRQKEAIGRGITSKPDLDNYIKLVLDALNGVVFRDDKDIAAIIARKVWTDKEAGTNIVVTVAEYGEASDEDQTDHRV